MTCKGNFWKKNATKEAGRLRAQKLYPVLGQCDMCEEPAVERHHKDDNTLNNNPSNIMFLCRHHHMVVDGRMGIALVNCASGREKTSQHAKQAICVNCGIMPYPHSLRKGRCHACNEYFRRNGVERKVVDVCGKLLMKCDVCGKTFYFHRLKKRCAKCAVNEKRRNHALYERARRRRLNTSKDLHNLREVL